MLLNAYALPLAVFSFGESALFQSAISGAMGMAFSSAIGYARGGAMPYALSTHSHTPDPESSLP
eukprot:6178511-Pyramimonas_sp.AAC.1